MPDFAQFQTELQALYQRGDFAEARLLAEAGLEQFPAQAHLLHYWRVVMAARLEDVESALALLAEARQEGIWYGETLLTKSPALDVLQGRASFEAEVAAHVTLREQDPTPTFPLIILRSEGRCQQGGPPCPLMLALHANATTSRDSLDFWQPAAQAGWLVGAPLSSQAMWRDAYIWDDREVAEGDLLRHFGALVDQYAVDPRQLVLAGHAMGGEVALWLALNGALAAQGVIAVGPSGPFTDQPQSWRQLIRDFPGSGLRVYLLVGEEDASVDADAVAELAEMLNAGGLTCELELLPHAGHDYSPEYEAAIQRALAFIAGGER